ncbi:class I SAM-dependent methyltransferase [candidate division KSB1 bacterium]|nr:class I SAM-dependent methyltransferase [candidate division KSB1 bacterium]
MKVTEYEAMFNAEQRHWWYNNLRDEVIEWVEKAQTANLCAKEIKLLDLGCGTGGMLQRLQQRFENIKAFGMDYYSPALDFARQKTRYPLVQGDAKGIPFCNDTFNIVLCLDVLYTKEAYPGFQNALEAVYDLLTENGAFILQLPAFKCLWSQHDLNVHGVHRFTANEIRESLRKAGFSRIKVYYRYNLLFGIAWFARRFVVKNKQESHLVVPQVFINSLPYKYFGLESWVNKRLFIPFGVSVFAVAFKQDCLWN